MLGIGLSLGTAWIILQATGYSIDMPFGELVVRQILIVPTLLIFPAVLWATRFFTPEESRGLRAAWKRLGSRLSRRAAPAAEQEAVSEAVAGVAGSDDPVTGDLAGGTASEAELAREEDRMERAWAADGPTTPRRGLTRGDGRRL